MKTSFKLTISRLQDGKNDKVSFDVESFNGSIRLRFDMDKSDFVDALTGCGYTRTRIGDVWGSFDNLHKYNVHRDIRVTVPGQIPYGAEDEVVYKALMLLPKVQEYQKDGWEFSSYFSSQGQVSHLGPNTVIKAHMSKWVEYADVEEADRRGFHFAENEQHVQEMKDLEKA